MGQYGSVIQDCGIKAIPHLCMRSCEKVIDMPGHITPPRCGLIPCNRSLNLCSTRFIKQRLTTR